MKESVLRRKSLEFAIRIVNVYKYLCLEQMLRLRGYRAMSRCSVTTLVIELVEMKSIKASLTIYNRALASSMIEEN